jgi:uncharacterized protein (TIGR02271 family)
MQSSENVRVGAEAVDRRGEKIGTIEDVGTKSFVVSKGLFFKKDLYIPFSAVEAVDYDGWVRVNVDKDQIDTMGWDEPLGVDWTTADAGDVNTSTYGSTVPTDGVGYDESRGSGDDGTDVVRVPVHEEQLRAEKVRESAGEVEIRKDVLEEEQTLDVPVTREEIDVRRYAVDHPASEAGIVDTGDTIRVPVMGERVNVEKDVRVAEELEINKRAVTENQRLSDTVRREEVDIERDGDVDVADVSRTTRRSRKS